MTSLLSVKPTCMTISRTLISNCLAICQSIAKMLGICTALVFMIRANFRLLERLFLRMKTILMFSFGSSTFYFYFLYRSPSSSSCSVVEAVSSNTDKVLILQPSANIMVCGDFNAHNTDWFVIPIPLMLQVCFFQSLLWHKTSPRLLIYRLSFLTVSHIVLTYSFVLILTLALLLLILFGKI